MHCAAIAIFITKLYQVFHDKLANMAARIRNDDWKYDQTLKDDLEKYSRGNLQRKEILDFMKREYGEYAWSLRTLD